MRLRERRLGPFDLHALDLRPELLQDRLDLEVRVPHLEVAHPGEGAHRHAVLVDRVEHDLVLVLGAESVVARGNDHARGEALDVPLPGPGERLVEVVDVEHEPALGRREHAEVRQVGVAAALHGQTRAGRAREVVRHDLGGAAVEREGRDEHPPVADRDQLGDARARLVLEQIDRIRPIVRRLVFGMTGSRNLGARRLPARDPLVDGEMNDDLCSCCPCSSSHDRRSCHNPRTVHHPMRVKRAAHPPFGVMPAPGARGDSRPRSMPTDDSYGQQLTWSPQRPRYNIVHVLVSWLVTGVAVFVAAAIVPHVSVGSFADALAAAVLIAALNARAPARGRGAPPAVHACARLRAGPRARRVMLLLASHITTRTIRVDSFGWALLASRRDRRGDAGAGGDLRRQRRRHVLAAGDQADSAPAGRAAAHRCPGDPVPGDRRPGSARARAGDPRRQHAANGELAERGTHRLDRVGDRPVLADRREPGGHPARLQPRHSRLSLGREGDGQGDGCSCARRLRRDRAALATRQRAAHRRRRQPREPVLGRGRRDDPDRQPDGRREAGQPRLSRVPGQRLQRHPRAGPVLLGGAAGEAAAIRSGDAGLAPWLPRRPLSVPARRAVRRSCAT